MTTSEPAPTTRAAAGRTIWNKAIAFGVGGFVLWFGASTVTTIVTADGAGSGTDRTVQIAVMAAIYLAILWRAAGVRVKVTEHGLVVRNVWRTHRLAWERIRGFEPQRQGFLLHRTAAVLQDGTRVPLAAVTLVGDATSGWGVTQTERLNAERLAATHGRSIADAEETVRTGATATAASRPTATAPRWARIVLPLAVLLVGLPLLAPGIATPVAWALLTVLVAAAVGTWRAVGGALDVRAWPLWTAAGVVLFLRVMIEIGERSG